MSEKTTNYQLTKLDSAEIGSMIDLNSNADKLDAALKQNHEAQQRHNADQSNPHCVTKEQVGLENADNTADKNKPVSTAQQKALDGKADLGTDGRVPASQLPSYVDDVLEYGSKIEFPNPGESGKIYVATDTNLTYRWSGTAYVEISPSLALGETANMAFRGDLGKQNAEAIESLTEAMGQKASANHSHSASDISTGMLPVSRGGTGQTSLAGVKNSLGITELANNYNRIGTVYVGEKLVTSVPPNTHTEVLKFTLPAGTYIITANVEWGIGSTAITVMGIYSEGNNVLALMRGNMGGGGGDVCTTIVTTSRNTEIRVLSYHGYASAVTLGFTSLKAVRIH